MNRKVGRPALAESGACEHKLMIRMNDEQMERIAKLAEFCEIPKTTMAKNLLMSGIEEGEALRKFGFLHVAKGLLKSGDFIKEFYLKRKELEKEEEKARFAL